MWRKNKHKFGARTDLPPCSYGYKHKSALELAVCNKLADFEKAGDLVVVKHEEHLKFPCDTCGESVIYWPDFTVLDVPSGKTYWVETKGFETDKWPKVKRAWKRAGPGDLYIYKGTWQNPKLVEVITPENMK